MKGEKNPFAIMLCEIEYRSFWSFIMKDGALSLRLLCLVVSYISPDIAYSEEL